MNPDQIPQLLKQVSYADPRVLPDDPDEVMGLAALWATVLADVPLDFAIHAVGKHYATSPFPIRPADIADRWRTTVRDRMTRHTDPTPPADPAAYLKQLRATRTAVATGQAPPAEHKQLTAGPAENVARRLENVGRYMPDTFDQWRPNRRGRLTNGTDPLTVPCPYDACRAPTGQPCRIGRRERATPHPSRTEAATSHQAA
ncbi:hypothetical protein ACLIYP_05465 [Streptomyces nanhaiensis]|uniref:zinc finger domain-containing protein n=1 Tax=Streptomyces nanhaiensis TaxID=679319 RepID=UPI00399C954C